ncbi:MAG: hypothetical protein ACYTEW_22765, partial [Planctomycetota bacterium]
MLKTIINLKRSDDVPVVVSVALAISVFATLFAIFYVRSTKEVSLGESLFVISGKWDPYTGEDIVENGIISAIVKATISRMGYQAKFAFSSWEEGLDILEASETNTEARAAFPFIDTPDRRQRFIFSDEPLLRTSFSMFYMANRGAPIKDEATLGAIQGRPL